MTGRYPLRIEASHYFVLERVRKENDPSAIREKPSKTQ